MQINVQAVCDWRCHFVEVCVTTAPGGVVKMMLLAFWKNKTNMKLLLTDKTFHVGNYLGYW